jgi:glycerol-3-phosphate dehydrogenase
MDSKMGEKLHPKLPYIKAEVIWAVRNEMALTLEDVLSRRTRALILDVAASLDAAADVASIMAAELGQGEAWKRKQIDEFTRLAKGYLPFDRTCLSFSTIQK